MSFGHQYCVLTFLAALFVFGICGCVVDPDVSWRRRTEEQLGAIRSGERHTIFCPYPAMLAELPQDPDVARNLTEVRSWDDVSSADFAHLADFPNLESVSLYGARGTDTFLKHVVPCKDVRRISIDQTDLSDAGLAIIAQMKSLTDLRVNAWGDRLSAEGLNHLAATKTLRRLYMCVGPSTPNLDSLRSALPYCDIQLEVEN